MSIFSENKGEYPANWKQISLQVRQEAGWRCEECGAGNGHPHPVTGSKVVLSVHHINAQPEDNRRDNLVALCRRCHFKAHMRLYLQNYRENKARREREAAESAGQMRLL